MGSVTDAHLFIIIFAAVLGMLGNAIVIIVRLYKHCYTSSARSAYKFLILHLAIADAIFAMTIAFDIKEQLDGGFIIQLGRWGCKVIKVVQSVSGSSTVGFLVIMALERYRGLTMVMRRKKWSLRWVGLLVVLVWIYFVLAMLPMLFALDVHGGYCMEIHHPSEGFRKTYTMFLFITNYILPLIVMSFAHSRIIYRISQHNMMLRFSFCSEQQKISVSSTSSIGFLFLRSGDMPCVPLSGPSRAMALKKTKKDRKISKMLAAVTLCFALFTLPSQIFYIWYDFGGSRNSNGDLNFKLMTMFGGLVYLHCCINPILYSVMDSNFRKDCLQLVRTIFSCKKINVLTRASEIASQIKQQTNSKSVK